MTVPTLEKKKPAGAVSGFGACGRAVKRRTTTVKRWPRAIALDGVITSSDPCRVKEAALPSTDTDPTDRPAKSRSNRDSAWVATARTVTVPVMVCDGFFLGYVRC